MADTIDWTDPCAAAERLRAAYYRILEGSQEQEVTYLANGVTRTLIFSKVDLPALIAELRSVEADCAAKQGLARPRRRFAIQFGSRGY
jgi:hypothetical protein